MLSADQSPRLSVVVDNGQREPRTYSPSTTARPGERHEPLPIDMTPALLEAWRDATLLRLPGPLGLGLLTEAYLAEVDLHHTLGAKAPRALEQLDGLASAARVSARTTGPSRDYLRTLLGLTFTACQGAPLGTAIIPVPMRLVGRATDALPAAARSTLMKRAVAWEVAAVAGNRTMSEWVPWSLLGKSLRSSWPVA